MQRLLVPVRRHQLRKDDSHRALRIFAFGREHVLQQGTRDIAEGRMQLNNLGLGHLVSFGRLPQHLPPGLHALAVILIAEDVQHTHAAVQCTGETQSGGGRAVPIIDRYEQKRRLAVSTHFYTGDPHLRVHLVVVPTHAAHQQQKRNQHGQRNPGAAGEFGNEHEQGRGPGRHRAGQVDREKDPAMRVVVPAPMLHHPGLRQRKRQKRSNGEQWNQPVRHAVEEDEHARGKHA